MTARENLGRKYKFVSLMYKKELFVNIFVKIIKNNVLIDKKSKSQFSPLWKTQAEWTDNQE